ncbi:MAG: MEMO1 family protein [Caldisericia bacterium]|nr:MEMO1 family protein [Caldisericia bacterium]
MKFLIGGISPHPPLLIPEIGGLERKYVKKTDESLFILAEKIIKQRVETILFMSPHSPFIRDGITIFSGDTLYGDFSQFGASEVCFEYKNDIELVDSIINIGKNFGIKFYKLPPDYTLDHGILVPLYYLDKLKDYEFKIVCMSQHFTLDRDKFKIFKEIFNEIDLPDKRIAFIASGDMSHRLLSTGPYGFHPSGPKFDNLVIEAIKNENFEDLLSIPENLIEEASECGYRSILTLFTLMPFDEFKAEILSYEGPFGVGYLVCIVERRENA